MQRHSRDYDYLGNASSLCGQKPSAQIVLNFKMIDEF